MAATISQTDSQLAFYKRWLMGRAAFDPKDFGVKMNRKEFIDAMADAFNDTYHGMWTIDDLCIRPRDALKFCDDFRTQHRCPDVPEYIILGSLMNRRKRG